MERLVVATVIEPLRDDWALVATRPSLAAGTCGRLGPEKAEALWRAHAKLVPESADFVMYWWDRAAELLTREGTVLPAGRRGADP